MHPIDFYWAKGPNLADKLGSPVRKDAASQVGTHIASTSIASLGPRPADATHIIAVATSPNVDPAHNVASVVAPPQNPPPTTNIEFISFEKNNKQSPKESNGNFEVKYRVDGDILPDNPNLTLAVHWATGPRQADIISGRAAVAIGRVSRNNTVNIFSIKTYDLIDPPSTATHLVAVLDNGQVFAETNENDNIGSVSDLNAPLSFELESSSTAIDPAPEAPTREERVWQWLRGRSSQILTAASDYNIDPTAIAGAIAWEALQNVTKRSARGTGPGKVHAYEFFEVSAAEFIEGNSVYTSNPSFVIAQVAGANYNERLNNRKRILRQPAVAIRYIAAIMNAYAVESENAGYVGQDGIRKVRERPEILATYYNGVSGFELSNSQVAFRQRRTDPNRGDFIPGPMMGQWVENNRDFLRSALGLP